MWVLIFAVMFIIFAVSFIYLISRFCKFTLIKKLAGGKKGWSWVSAAIAVFVIAAAVWMSMGIINSVICMIHLMMIWLICDFACFLVKRFLKKEINADLTGGAVLLLTVIYLSVGWYLAHHVAVTSYIISAAKETDGLRIVLFSDSHVGTTFHAKEFAGYVEQMQEQNPDIVVIAGDFIDDDTTKEDMIGSCEALSKLNPTYGVYYVYGNHDKGYYGRDYRGYNSEDLAAELEKNGVVILEDEVVPIGDYFYLIGRQDKSEESKGGYRASMEELVSGLDSNRFCIVLDHQPQDYRAQEAAKVDLVLSGHTHGGQFFPFNKIGEWTKINDKTYGYEKRGETGFIVSSGISDWAIKFKTGCKSEYVVIDIR